MKSLKKLVFVLVMTLLLLVVFGCDISFGGTTTKVDNKGDEPGTDNPAETVDLQTVFNAIVSEIGDRANVVSDLVLPATKDGVSIVWTSDKPEVISNDGKVTRSLDDEKVVLSCILKYGDTTKQFNISVTVKGNRSEVPDGYDKIIDVVRGEDGAHVISGVVVAVTSQSFIVKDETSFILVYKGKNFAKDVEVGSKVVVSGNTSVYGGLKQFGTDATYEVGEKETVSHPMAMDCTGTQIDNLINGPEIMYVKISGILKISGSYVNIEVAGAQAKGSISYPVEDLSAFDGKGVDVVGYFVGVTGSATKYINVISVSITENSSIGTGDNPTPTPTDATEGTLAEIAALEVGKDYKATAVVVATAKQGLLLKDDSGLMYAYLGADLDASIVVGTKLEVVGKTSLYGGFVQFDKPTLTVKGEEQVTQPEPTVLTQQAYEDLLTATTMGYYKLTAEFSISNNKYFNLKFDGSSVAGSIVAPREDLSALNGKNVEVEGYFVYVSGSTTKYIYFIATSVKEVGGTVTPVETIEGTIAEVLAGTVGGSYKTTGTVVAVNAQSFLVQDDSGIILAYEGTGYQKDLEVGDVVNLEGKTTTYQGSVQFDRPTYEKTGEKKTVTYPEPVVLDVEKYEALNTATPTTQYVSLVAEVVISKTFVNLYVSGTTLTGSIAYPAEDLSSLDGKLVKVTGYYTYAAGSDTKYIYIVATNIGEATDEETVNFIANDFDLDEEFAVFADLTLTTEAYGATISWASSNEAALTSAGKYLAPANDTTVKLTATITKGEVSKTVEMDVLVKAPETIGNILALTELTDTEHFVKGVVVAIYGQGFLIKDSTGYILVYKGNNFSNPDLTIGKEVVVLGAVVEYGGAKQFGQDASYGILGDAEFTQPEPRVLDKDAFEALAQNVQVEYVKFTGTLSFSGRYYNVAVEDATVTGSIAYPVENYQALNGKKIDVTGYYAYITTSGDKQYLYFITTSVEETILSDEEYVALAEEEILKMNGKSYKKDLALPLESNKCTVSWVSSNAQVIANDGKFTMPEADTEVKLTATITKGEQTKTVEVTVTALYVDPNAVTPIVIVLGEHEEFATWSNAYTAHELVFDDVKVEFTRADKQTGTVTDAPVLACNSSNPTVYATVTGNFEGMKYARVITKEWNAGATAKYGDIHLEYTTDGTTWVKCSDVFTEPGTMLSTEMSDIKAFRLSYTMKEGSSGNAQLPLVSFEFAATEFPNE